MFKCMGNSFLFRALIISSIEKSNGNSIEFFLSNADKGAVGLIPALELASLIPS